MAIGERVRHLGWDERTSGAAAYTGDVQLPGMLVARVLRSPHPHARIVAIDAIRARTAPGVAAVVTRDDFADVRYVHHGGPLADRRPIARDVVRYVGEEVAAVAAETREQAEAALSLIRVGYEPLPAATTVPEALAEDAPRIHDTSPHGNVSVSVSRRFGTPVTPQPDEVVMTGSYRFGRQAHVCMEPGSTVARWDADEQKLELWTSTQAPYFIRKEVAHVLGLEMEQVVTHRVAVGGGFGAKSKIADHEVLAARLSMKAGRPVRLVLDRDEDFATTKCRHAFDVDLETRADRNGRLLGRRAQLTVDNGAYNHSGPSVMGYGISLLASQYRIPSAEIDGRLVYTNKHPGGQFRGYGGPQVVFALESQIDELADELGMDPIDLRIANANATGDVTIAGWKIPSSALVECLERVRREIDWDTKRARGGSGRGVGVAVTIHVSGARVYEGAERSSAGLDIGADGRVHVRFGGADAGTWQETMLAQAAASELGVDVGDVDVLTMETGATPIDMGAWSSRGTYMSGHAVKNAAERAAVELRGLAAGKLGCEPDQVRLSEGRAHGPADDIALGDLVALSDRASDGLLTFEEEFVTTDAEPFNRETGIANLSATYAFAAQAVEVEVDPVTGAVKVCDVVAVHDSGIALNPISAESQIVGGVAMGLGAALGEELLYAEGKAINPAYLNYPLPRAADLPPIRPVLIEHEDPVGPYGAKGLGEIVLIPTAAAVANAVAHAVGVRVRDLPITPDKVLTGLRERRGTAPRRYGLWRRPGRWWIQGMRWAYPRGAGRLLHRVGTRFARRREPRPVAEVVTPGSVTEAVDRLGDRGARPVGGGTDLLPARRQGLVNPRALVDVTRVDGMTAIDENPQGDLMIGGSVTLAQLARDPRIGGALRETVESIASAQIREMATVAGNLCQQKRCWFYRNGFDCYKRGGPTCPCYAVEGDHRFYHAAMDAHRCQAVTPSDLATTFAALDGVVTLRGRAGSREVSAATLYRGPGETVLRSDELLTRVRLPAAARARVTRFSKLRLWQGDFAVASVCASLSLDAGGTVRDVRVVLGAIAPTPYRCRETEQLLRGRRLTDDLATAAGEAAIRAGHPLPGNAWKLEAVAGMVARTLVELRDRSASREAR